jgi:branched-subunit amino acid transport protein
MNTVLDGFNQLGWWAIFIFVVLATYFWRGLGVLLAGNVSQDGEIFKWLSCVTYALVGALTIKLILYPTGILSQVPMAYRLGICCICLFYRIQFRGQLTMTLILGSLLMALCGFYIQST